MAVIYSREMKQEPSETEQVKSAKYTSRKKVISSL